MTPLDFFFGGTLFFWLAMLFVGPVLTMRLLSEERIQDLSQINGLMRALETRVALLSALRLALDVPGVHLSIGSENELPELHSLSVVAAGYGLPGRTLGAVSVLGPVRMDYGHAIVAVREAAAELSRFVARLEVRHVAPEQQTRLIGKNRRRTSVDFGIRRHYCAPAR